MLSIFDEPILSCFWLLGLCSFFFLFIIFLLLLLFILFLLFLLDLSFICFHFLLTIFLLLFAIIILFCASNARFLQTNKFGVVLALILGLCRQLHVTVKDGAGDLVLDLGKLLHGRLGSTTCHSWVNNTCQEGNCAHDGVATAGKGDWLEGQGAKSPTSGLGVLQEGILNG